jgi:hypothetical protein
MPPLKYRGRIQEVNFTSEDERKSWLEDATKMKIPFSKYILEMARLGRLRESSRPKEMMHDLAAMREENTDLRRKLTETQELLKRTENDLFKLRHSSVLQPGESAFYEPLVSLLQEGGLIHGSELLRRLGIDPGDQEATKIVSQHLQVLRSTGLIREETRGWRWVKDE